MTDFREQPSDHTAMSGETSRTDTDGYLSALLKIYTTISGLSFDAGLPGIMDTNCREGEFWLYLPCTVRALSVSHAKYSPLRGWSLPVCSCL